MHIVPAAEMRACAISRMGGCKPGTERVGSAPMTSTSVDTAEMGDAGDFKLSTVAPLDKIDPPFPYVVVLKKLK